MECGCSDGLVYNPATGLCEGLEEINPIISPNIYNVGPGSIVTSYGNLGGGFYENITGRPFPISSTGSDLEDASNVPVVVNSTIINSLWGDSGFTTGRLNNAGVWTDLISGGNWLPLGEWIGFTTCVDVPETKEYNIGIAGDNRLRVKIDGEVIAVFDTGSAFAFRRWHVLPITLTAGEHVIELEGKNDSSQAAFAAEIYDADQATLIAMTNTTELDAVTIFSTEDQIGRTFDIGEFSGLSCPDGYALNTCGDTPMCTIRVSEPIVPCPCYLLTDCSDPTNTRLVEFDMTTDSLDTNLIYQFTEFPGICWTVEESTACEGGEGEVTTLQTFTTCEDCLPPIPEPVELGVACDIRPREAEPGFNIQNCDEEKFLKIKKRYADAIYQEYVAMRYGIKICCDYDLDELEVDNRLLELGEIYNPELCVDGEPVPECCPEPTNVSVDILLPNFTTCPSPTNSSAIISFV